VLAFRTRSKAGAGLNTHYWGLWITALRARTACAIALTLVIVVSCHRARPTTTLTTDALPYGYLPAWRTSLEAQCNPRFRPPNDPVSRISQPVGRFELDLQHPGIISGVVTTRDNTAMADAPVELRGPYNIIGTDAMGSFTLNPLLPGRYVLRTRAIGYEARWDTIEVTATAGVRVRLPLQQSPVYLNDGCGMVRGVSSRSAADRALFVAWEPPVCHSPFSRSTMPQSIIRPDTLFPDAITGELFTADGPVLGGRAVWLDDLHRLTMTDSSGAFRFDHIPAGRHILRSTAIGYVSRVDTLTVTSQLGWHLRLALAENCHGPL